MAKVCDNVVAKEEVEDEEAGHDDKFVPQKKKNSSRQVDSFGGL